MTILAYDRAGSVRTFDEDGRLRVERTPISKANANGLNQQGQLVGVGNAPWSGYWLPVNITHEISSEIPGGPWFTHVECQRTNFGEKVAVKTS